MRHGLIWIALATVAAAPPAITERSVRAAESFLAGDALNGRGSATHDEAVAAAYVASRFEAAGLQPAPGVTGYVQTARIIRTLLTAPPRLVVDGKAVPGVALLRGGGAALRGKLAVVAPDGTPPPGATVVAVPDATASIGPVYTAARAAGVALMIVPETDRTRAIAARSDGVVSKHLEGMPAGGGMTLVTVPAAAMASIVRAAGGTAALELPGTREDTISTTNAVGYLPGSDPKAKLLLLTAHLDHLGVRADGTIMHGANDDASGTVAVIELAQALAADGPHRRGILFAAYGSEEAGEFGSEWFAAHPPVPLDRIAANLEFEMVGAQDPKLPRGTLMMTGYGRSTLGPALKAHGAAVTADPYPDEHFFERSDNYQLALAGVVAHTLSGWATPPTYHDASDTIANLDIPFMTRAIRSLVAPVTWLADGSFEPSWTGAGRPKR